MIAFIRGTVEELTESSAVIETGNIGYEIFMPEGDLGRLSMKAEVKIYTYFHVREDAVQLYGFLRRDDREIFRLLLGVSGIGPKGAVGVLSGMSADELRFAVLSDDVKTISKAPGIGRKTAQKLILELKDKLKLEDAFELKMAHKEEALSLETEGDLRDGRKEAVQALVALGYSSTDAMRAVRQVKDVPSDNVEAILKAALKNF